MLAVAGLRRRQQQPLRGCAAAAGRRPQAGRSTLVEHADRARPDLEAVREPTARCRRRRRDRSRRTTITATSSCTGSATADEPRNDVDVDGGGSASTPPPRRRRGRQAQALPPLRLGGSLGSDENSAAARCVQRLIAGPTNVSRAPSPSHPDTPRSRSCTATGIAPVAAASASATTRRCCRDGSEPLWHVILGEGAAARTPRPRAGSTGRVGVEIAGAQPDRRRRAGRYSLNSQADDGCSPGRLRRRVASQTYIEMRPRAPA